MKQKGGRLKMTVLGPVLGVSGVVAAVALVGLGVYAGVQPASLVQVQVSQSGTLIPMGSKNLWESAISREPQRLKKLHQVDFHRMPVENCPVGTPGCAKPRWAQQADHQIVLATDGRPRNYVYNYFTDEADSANDLGQDKMVKYVHPPLQALSDRGGDTRDGEHRYKNKLGDNILDVPNNEGWQSGDIHMAMDGHDRMPVSHIYKAKKQTSTLRASTVVPHGKLALPRQARPFEAKQAVLHRSLHLSEPIHLLRSGAHNASRKIGAHTLFNNLGLGHGGEARDLAPHRERRNVHSLQVHTLVVSPEANVLDPNLHRATRRVQRKEYFGASASSATKDLNSYFDELNLKEEAAHRQAQAAPHLAQP